MPASRLHILLDFLVGRRNAHLALLFDAADPRKLPQRRELFRLDPARHDPDVSVLLVDGQSGLSKSLGDSGEVLWAIACDGDVHSHFGHRALLLTPSVS
jgi:hypothetical protein